MRQTIVHADDFAISEHAAVTVAELVKAGSVQSVSIMPNMGAVKTGISLLQPYKEVVLVSDYVKINIV